MQRRRRQHADITMPSMRSHARARAARRGTRWIVCPMKAKRLVRPCADSCTVALRIVAPVPGAQDAMMPTMTVPQVVSRMWPIGAVGVKPSTATGLPDFS